MRNRVEIKKKMDTEIFPIFKNRLSGQAKKKAKHGQSRKKHKIVKKTWKSGKKSRKAGAGAGNRHRHFGCRLSLTGTGTGTGTYKPAPAPAPKTGTGTGTGTSFWEGADIGTGGIVADIGTGISGYGIDIKISENFAKCDSNGLYV